MDSTFAMDFNDISNEWDRASNMEENLPGLELDFTSSNGSSKSERGFSPVLTPPDSHSGSPVNDHKAEGNACVSVSTTFFPSAPSIGETDLTILASDSVFFYVSSKRLQAASRNGFNSHLPLARESGDSSDPILSVPESSSVINILLHTIYDMSCMHYYPSLTDVIATVAVCKIYGISLKKYLAAGTPLSQTVLSYAPTNPLEVYALAASNDLHDLAVTTSSHLLSFQLPTLTDDMATRIGPVYLKKLFFLHLGRTDALKRLLVSPPVPHAQTVNCDFNSQKSITRAWSLAAAYLTWEARPDLSASTIETTLQPLADHLTCGQCRAMLLERIREVVVQWSMVKRTI